MPRITWIFILILALAVPASALPALPAEFSGTVTIDGNPAPAGTVITARIGDREFGSLTLTAAGVYGGEGLYDDRLMVKGEDTDAGKTITFFVDGMPAGTAVYAPGTSPVLALTVTTGGTTGGSSGSSGGGAGSSTPATPTPAATATEFTGSGSLDTDAGGVVRHAAVISAAEGDARLSIDRGVRAQDRSGNPLDTVSIKRVPLEALPDAAEPVGRAIRCGPDGATFDPAIEVAFTLTPEEWERYEAGQFVVRWYDSGTGAWEPLVTTVRASTRTITAAVPHFTLVAVFAGTVPAMETPQIAVTTAPTAADLPTFEALAMATTVQQAGLPFSWLAVLPALAGAALLVCMRNRG